jgi:CRP-like cAMP-binding protein
MAAELESPGTLDLLLRLRRFRLLQSVPLESLAALARVARLKTFADGELVARAGEAWGSVSLVLEGAFAAPGQELDSERLELLGALAVFAREPLPLAVVARGPTRALCLPADGLLEMAEEDFGAMEEVMRGLARMLLDRPVSTGGLPPGALPVRGMGALDLVQRMLIALADTARSAVEESLDGQAPLWRQGDPPRDIVLVVSGAVEARPPGAPVLRAGPYGVLGGLDILAATPRRYEAWPEPGAVVLRVPAERLMGHFEDHPEVAMDLLGVLARDVLEALLPPVAAGQTGEVEA